MTEKRFKLFVGNDYGVKTVDGVVIFDSIRSIADAEVLVDWLNELYEENTQLKRNFDSCSHNWALMYDEAKEKVEALTKENWELEQENEKLENKLWNCTHQYL